MQTVQVRLLNDGGYDDVEDVIFPILVDGYRYNENLISVRSDELVKVGFGDTFNDLPHWLFLESVDCEVVS